MNFTVNIDLSRLSGARTQEMNIDGTLQRCLILPIDSAHLYEGSRGVYLDLKLVEHSSAYGDTHFAKQSVSKKAYDAMTFDQRSAIPILGNAKPLKPLQEGQVAKNEVSRPASPVAEPPFSNPAPFEPPF